MWATRWSRSPCYWAPSPSLQAAHNLRRFVHAYSAGHPWPAGDTTSCSHRAPPRAQGNRRRAQRATVPTTAAREVSESPPNRPETLISIGRPERHSWARLPLSDGEGDRDGAPRDSCTAAQTTAWVADRLAAGVVPRLLKGVIVVRPKSVFRKVREEEQPLWGRWRVRGSRVVLRLPSRSPLLRGRR